VLDYAAILRAALSAGYDGPLTIEFLAADERPIAEKLRDDVRFIRDVLAESPAKYRRNTMTSTEHRSQNTDRRPSRYVIRVSDGTGRRSQQSTSPYESDIVAQFFCNRPLVGSEEFDRQRSVVSGAERGTQLSRRNRAHRGVARLPETTAPVRPDSAGNSSNGNNGPQATSCLASAA